MEGFNHRSGKSLHVRGADIYYEAHGNESDPVLLFLHGALGNIEDLNGIVSQIPGNKFRIVGIDNRGHGKSTLGNEDLSYELLQEEVEAVLRHLGIDKLTIIGFSNGGTVAYRLAVFSKLKVERLVTIGAPWSSEHIEHLREPYSALTSEMWRQQCPADYAKFEQLSPESDFDRIFKQAIQMALDTSSKSRPNQNVEHISCPVLALRGENDPVVSQSNLDELVALLKNGRAVNIPNAGHEAFLDQLAELIKPIREFLHI